MSTSGKIVQVIGAVIDVAFAEENVPNILDAIVVEFTVNDEKKQLVLEFNNISVKAWFVQLQCHLRMD